jgi:hypothetical protein
METATASRFSSYDYEMVKMARCKHCGAFRKAGHELREAEHMRFPKKVHYPKLKLGRHRMRL